MSGTNKLIQSENAKNKEGIEELNKELLNANEEAIKDEPRMGQPKKYDETDNADIIAMACSQAPDGRSRWTIRLLEKTLNQKGLMINRESIRLLLKKTNVSLG